MSADHFKVYRVADAPQWACNFAALARDDDPVFIIDRTADPAQILMAAEFISLFCLRALRRNETARPIEGGTDACIVYTIDRRGVQ